jgi:hypothetical protein
MPEMLEVEVYRQTAAQSLGRRVVAVDAPDAWVLKGGTDQAAVVAALVGRKFVNDMSRVMLRAYNAEAENCVKTVKAGNLPVAQARLRKAMDSIEKQGQLLGDFDQLVGPHKSGLFGEQCFGVGPVGGTDG